MSALHSSYPTLDTALPFFAPHEKAPLLLCAPSAREPAVARIRKAEHPGDLEERKLQRLKRSGLLGNDTHGATVERARTAQDLKSAYRLVHDVYVQSGFIHAHSSGIRLRMSETSADTATFVAKIGNEVVGVLSIVAEDADLGLPSDTAFLAELDGLRAIGGRICELTNQVVAPHFRKSALAAELMRCAVAHAIETGFDTCVATVSPAHRAFYELLGFKILGAERNYSTELDDPVIALTFGLDRFRGPAPVVGTAARFMHHQLGGGNPYRARIAAWTAEARAEFLDPHTLGELFAQDRNFIAECPAAHLRILRRRWGAERFAAVSHISRLCACGEPQGDETGLLATLGLRLDRATDAMQVRFDQALARLWARSDCWRALDREARSL